MLALLESKRPEQTAKSFCAASGISEATYYYWLKRVRQSNKAVASDFVPIQCRPYDRLAIATIQMPGGSVISVYDVEVLSFMQPFL